MLEYLAPEIVDQRPYGEMVDHWALGILTYELLAGESPFNEGGNEAGMWTIS